MYTPRVVMAGGAGTAGRAFARLLVQRGYRVTLLSRNPGAGNRAVPHAAWDGVNQGAWTKELEGACGVVNLLGANGAQDARVHRSAITALSEAAAACADPPPVWLQAGSLGIYGNEARPRPADECTAPGADACAQSWADAEGAFHDAPVPGVRRAVYRLGMVLGDGPRASRRALELARWAQESPRARNDARVSWIHADDLARLLFWGLRMEIIAGAYNACVPEAAPLPAFAEACGFEACARHAGPAATPPEPLVHAVPRRFIDIAYQFRNEDLESALAAMSTEDAADARAAEAALR